VLDDPWGDQAVAVKFDCIPDSVEALHESRFDGVAAVGDRPAVLAAAAAERLGLPFHPLAAALACNDKYLARQLYRATGLLVPSFFRAMREDDPVPLAERAPYPCVLKPLRLSASRGVIRANNQAEFLEAFRRIRKLGEAHLQVESYIPGREFAIEGLVTRGRFQPLAIFDKPDPLEGPYFEESIYVTPSRETAAVQQELLATTARAVEALRLRHGPVHAELRYNAQGAWILETAARPIGGLCAKALRFAPSIPLEELILRHALGEEMSSARLADAASGVMMIPIPKSGIYQSVDGIDQAQATEGVEEVIITAKSGQQLVPLPEGASYLGFIFARGPTPQDVESALRAAHAKLSFRIQTALETLAPSA
jgi:biotin carboxylase